MIYVAATFASVPNKEIMRVGYPSLGWLLLIAFLVGVVQGTRQGKTQAIEKVILLVASRKQISI